MNKISKFLVCANRFKDIPDFNEWIVDNQNNQTFTKGRFNKYPKIFMDHLGNIIKSELDKRFEPSIPTEIYFDIFNPSKDKGHVQINMVGDKKKNIPYRFIELWYYVDKPLVLDYYDKEKGKVSFKVKTISDLKKVVRKINKF